MASSVLKCSKCGLQVRIQAPYLAIKHCPRCLARTGRVSTMEHSDEPAAATPAHAFAGLPLVVDGVQA
jgi:hypothetical protein